MPVPRRTSISPFDRVAAVARSLPDVELATRYDGAPVLRVGGVFMAALASHPSAEPGSLIVRSAPDDRQWLLEDAPEVYYVTDYYRKHPVVLARLARLDRAALRELLGISRRLALTKTRVRSSRRARPSGAAST